MTTLNQQWADLYASGRVRWMAGMRTEGGSRAIVVNDTHVEPGHALFCSDGGNIFKIPMFQMGNPIPDFSDPATIGCLLHQAREAWDRPYMTLGVRNVQTSSVTRSVVPAWYMQSGPDGPENRREPMGPLHRMCMAQHDTEPAAILAAIAAAPPRSET